ncbi:MAG: hypothetical protein M1816_007796 [Peltula sp. TS41687]|nr:MAG: hypothetical protein M1816_007796 [Peltula sp. TS41687]
MADPGAQTEAMPVDPLFRPAKRRRHYRKRGDDIEAEESNAAIYGTRGEESPDTEPSPSKANAMENQENETIKATEILRLRQQVRNRRGGIEFVNGVRDMSITASSAEPGPERDAVASSEGVVGLVNRFAPQTGQVADVNRHMMAYIDCELERLRQGSAETGSPGTGATSAGDQAMANASRVGFPQRQPATLGKLHEIDLGPDARLTNIAKTEAAKKKMEAGEDEDGVGGTTTKVRLGKDGKPWRGRRVRTSDDLKRDKLVEEVLRESKLDIYDEHEQETNADDTQAADDRIAEQFRRDFLDAISSRHRRRGGGAHAANKAKRDDRPKGPKLGGSRSARAAMREHQEKAKK